MASISFPGSGQVLFNTGGIIDMILDIPEDRDWKEISKLPLIIDEIKVLFERGEPLDWKNLSMDAVITFDDVMSTKDLKGFNWNFVSLTFNPNITTRDIISHPDLPWMVENILSEEDEIRHITLSEFFPTIDDPRFQWDWNHLSVNSGITFQDIESTLNDPRFHWDWDGISYNPNITIEDIRKTIDNPDYQWQFCILSQNPSITEEDIIRTWDGPRFEWKLYPSDLSHNPHVGMRTLRKIIEGGGELEKFGWENFSKKEAIPWKEIESTLNDPRYKWDWVYLTLRPDVSFQKIEETITYPNYKWFKPFISMNPNVTLDDVKRTIDDPKFMWYMKDLMKNPNFTPRDLERVLNDPDLRKMASEKKNVYEKGVYVDKMVLIDYGDVLSENPNFTYSVVRQKFEDLPMSWNWVELIKNEFSTKSLIKSATKQ